jgi:hypothetical protein
MAAIDFPASPTDGQQFVAPNGTIYQFKAAPGIWLPIAGTPVIYVGTTPPASPVVNQLWWNSNDTSPGGGQLYIYFQDADSTQWVPAAPAAQGPAPVATPTYDIFNTLLTDVSGTGGNVDTPLQITNGTQVFSRSFTAVDPAHPIEVDISGFMGVGTTGVWAQLALFIDGAANAVAQKGQNINASTGNDLRVYWQGVLSPGPHTFSVRLASSSGSTAAALNGMPGGRVGGGAMRTTMTIKEIGVGAQGPQGPIGPAGGSTFPVVVCTFDNTGTILQQINAGGYSASSVTKTSAGQFTLNGTFPPAPQVSLTIQSLAGNGFIGFLAAGAAPSATAISVASVNGSSALADAARYTVTVYQ